VEQQNDEQGNREDDRQVLQNPVLGHGGSGYLVRLSSREAGAVIQRTGSLWPS
jgi:hypothetical protein